jgi:hypothetical protein
MDWKKGGSCQPNQMVFGLLEKGRERVAREEEKEQNNVNGFKKCTLFSNFCTERVVFDCLKDKFLENFIS